MGIGSILVGIGVALIVGAYLARPFRKAAVPGDVDQVIETWVAQVHTPKATRDTGAMVTEADPINFCPQCGRRVSHDDRFCSGCGTQLSGDGE